MVFFCTSRGGSSSQENLMESRVCYIFLQFQKGHFSGTYYLESVWDILRFRKSLVYLGDEYLEVVWNFLVVRRRGHFRGRNTWNLFGIYFFCGSERVELKAVHGLKHVFIKLRCVASFTRPALLRWGVLYLYALVVSPCYNTVVVPI